MSANKETWSYILSLRPVSSGKTTWRDSSGAIGYSKVALCRVQEHSGMYPKEPAGNVIDGRALVCRSEGYGAA